MSERTRLHYPTVYVVHTEDKNRYKSVPDYTVYVGETKVAAARDHVENGLTKTEVMAKYAIASIAPLERWCREYRAGGPEALRPRPKGSKSKPKPEPTREQELAERVRPPADTHVPGPRVRTEGVGQERAQDHAAHGTEMRHPLQEPVEEVQLVQGRDGRPRA